MIAIILAGGSGTRFWPLSRHAHPKQSLTLWGDKPMIAHTVSRLSSVCLPEHILIVCGPHLLDQLRAALPDLDAAQFIVEPTPRNTAPAIALATAIAQRRFGSEHVIGVFPSDHFIGDDEAFTQCLLTADQAARTGAIVTLGICPTRPETGYGYICYQPPAERSLAAGRAWPVEAFVEKPDLTRAISYLERGDHLWNAGMFFFTPTTLDAQIAAHMPDLHAGIATIAAAYGTPDEHDALTAIFPTLPSISIDYGVMERASHILVIPATFIWSDVGHWAALPELHSADERGNVLHADAIAHDTHNTTVWSTTDRLVALVGARDLIVVDTPDALLILPRERAQDVRAITDELKRRRRDTLL
jgi:mannose-1-phosphate guanylyltransferase